MPLDLEHVTWPYIVASLPEQGDAQEMITQTMLLSLLEPVSMVTLSDEVSPAFPEAWSQYVADLEVGLRFATLVRESSCAYRLRNCKCWNVTRIAPTITCTSCHPEFHPLSASDA